METFGFWIETSLFQPDVLKKIVTQLEKIDFITDRLSLGDAKFMVSFVWINLL